MYGLKSLLSLGALAGLLLAGCSSAPVGTAQDLQGTYWQNAQVTNPDGNGPQVVRWGPPQNWNSGSNQ